VRDHNEELGLYVGGIALCIPNLSISHNFILQTYGGISSLGIPRNRSGLTPRSNNKKYPGCSYEAIAIYLKEFRKELME